MTDGALSRLGITPKDEWLNDCRSHIEAIGSSNGNGETTDDQILHEILHTDLRFVVRGLSMDMTETAASVLLREVVRASMSENDDGLHKASLPASFRIMVQIEELLDVSINAESRLKYGPSEIHEPAVGTQNSRCLKMIISDGFAELDDIGPLVAMECLPIRNLSSHSRAGIKMLLKGPIDVRYGVLNLHEGCVVVLGGCVEALLQVQKKAHEQAKKAACFGQDATIRALVMPHNDIGNDDAEEEGEVESSDLQPTNGTGTNQSSPSFFSPNNNMGPSNANVGMTETRRISARPLASIQNGTESGHSTHNPLLLNNRNLNADNSSEENASRPDAATNSFARSVATERKNPYTNTLSTGMQPTRRIPNRSTPVEATAITSTENSNRTSNTSSMTQNPYASSEINFNTSFQNQSTITSVREKENESADDQNDPGEIDIGTSLSPIMKISSPALQRNKQQNNGSLISTFLSETALSVPLSFREFVLKLEDFRKGANEYKKFETKTFIIPAKMKGSLKAFNIEKIKKKKDKKVKGEKLYGLSIVCSLVDISDISSRITCKLSSPVLEPYFSVPPGELRRLSKTDREKGNQITQEGGSKMCRALESPGSVSIKLILNAKDFFSKGAPRFDGNEAYLLVTAREDS